ncbi:hypothetical protein HNR46_001169 [Haloferula luteola]|uniref:Uncharacterized protein n=1 Tax=Haloferula luteola TaxID=595692 RepID=A0A840UYX0_9BACT|nr:hypothetical protein [Haloferula luteola]MBB5350935.1 hypothetical protein [Haloferula luteola]
MTKHGACEMIYTPEHVIDPDTGVIVAAEVRLGDQDLAVRVLATGEVPALDHQSAIHSMLMHGNHSSSRAISPR